MNPLAKAFWIAKGVGWDNVPRRVLQATRVRSGWLRRETAPEKLSQECFQASLRSTSGTASERFHERTTRFFPVPSSTQLRIVTTEPGWQQHVAEPCEALLAGQYPFFSRWTGELGWPPRFNHDPVNSIDWPVGEHWLSTTKSGPPRNDLKLVWEPSRLTALFLLARHYAYTEDPKWAEAIWQLIDAWLEQNPVSQTVAWGCGQEIALRVMAILFATNVTLDAPAATDARLANVELLCWQSARRIATNISYAISQENNHALSEAVGLLSVGLLFPEFRESPQWISIATRVLDRECRRQIYSDGSYVQHSMSYHRVMMDDLCWATALAARNSLDLPQAVHEKLDLAASWLNEFIDPESGRVPNFGANDGANVLPLSCTDYLDYRPTVEAARAVVNGQWEREYELEACEKALWLCGQEPSSQQSPSVRHSSWHAPIGGYYWLRGKESAVFTRATTFSDRPSQCDMLHVDWWYRGRNVLRDAGSFRYYHEDPTVKSYFYSSAAHNTVAVPGKEQMQKGPNFLWFHWPQATAAFVNENGIECIAKFPAAGYEHTRTIERRGEEFQLCDRVIGCDNFGLFWRLDPDFQWSQTAAATVLGELHTGERVQISIECESEFSLVLGEAWESLYYGERTLCPAIHVSHVASPIWTRFGPFQKTLAQ